MWLLTILTKNKLPNNLTKLNLLDIMTKNKLSRNVIMKPLKPKTGAPAEGEDYFFKREKIINKIYKALSNNENILISAPRRIGKSSILKFITQNPKPHQIIKYMIVQSAHSCDNFYKKVFNTLIADNEVFKLTESLLKKFSVAVKAYVSKIKGINFDGVTISENQQLNYYELVSSLFKELSQHTKHIVLIFDEFPDVVNNIYDQDKSEAVKFLQQHREFREEYSSSSLLFIYTGSTGLKNVVRKMGEIHLINNIVDIKVTPFSRSEATELIKRLVLGRQESEATFVIGDEVIEYIVDQVTWLLPYYLQILIEEIHDIYLSKNTEITKQVIDDAISGILKYDSSYSDYFENWRSRLKTAFQDKADLKLATTILNKIAIDGILRKSQLHDLMVKHNDSDGKYVEDVLRFDGYISLNEENKCYGFNSFLLKQWWYINVAT